MAGLTYPITHWEICNEVMYDSIANTPGTPAYPAWQGFTKEQYLTFMDSARDVINSTCADCKLFNGAQLLPPLDFFPSLLDLTYPLPDGLGPDIIDAISYHNYSVNLQIDSAMSDFATNSLQSKPIWITEAGTQNEYIQNNSLTQDDNARIAVGSFVYALYRGVSKIIFTTMRAGISDQESIQWESLLDPSTGDKKKIFYSYQKLIEKLDYFTDVTALPQNNDTSVFAYKFTVDGNPVYVLWANSIQTVNLNLGSGNVATSVDITDGVPMDEMGTFNTENIPVTDDSIAQIAISTIPLYVEPQTGTGIKEQALGMEWNIFPNIVKDNVNVSMSLNKDDNCSLKMYDITGRELKTLMEQKLSRGGHSFSFDLSSMECGIYYCRLVSSSGIQVKTIEILK